MNQAFSVVIPVFNEEGNILELLKEIQDAFTSIKEKNYEIICIDDASSDNTFQVLLGAKTTIKNLRILKHQNRSGQSTALRTGFLHSKGKLIITLDGDGQNNPTDIPALIDNYKQNGLPLVCGIRVKRQDSLIKKFSSRFANLIRSLILNDGIKDTGCGLKLFEKEVILRIPFFNHFHRYIPALVKREGYNYTTVPVKHRHRQKGASKYGTIDRLIAGIIDLLGVLWLRLRFRNTGKIIEK
jgi:dolichol-phosphate mannosyltransferase